MMVITGMKRYIEFTVSLPSLNCFPFIILLLPFSPYASCLLFVERERQLSEKRRETIRQAIRLKENGV